MPSFIALLVAGAGLLLALGVSVVLILIWSRRNAPPRKSLEIITEPPAPAPALNIPESSPLTVGPFLTLIDQANNQTYPLDELLAEAVHIGRNTDNQIGVDDPTVSDRHARIYYDATAQGVCIEDLDSLNGVYIDGCPTRKNILRNGVTLELGNRKFTFTDSGYLHPAPT